MDASKLDSLFDLGGRAAIVTGGTRGIGLAIAEGFVAAGASVVVASRKPEACAATESHLRSMGGEAVGVAANMGDPETPEALVQATVDAFGRLDIVVNNAANALALPLGEQTVGGWQKSFDVNLRGPALLMQAAAPELEKSEHASIVNVISVGAFLFSGGTSMYSATKAGLLSVTRSFAGTLASKGIRVNALAPGTTDTDMVRGMGENAAEWMSAGTLLKRAADPDEMVGPALFLASDASSYVTGQVLVADGGMHPH